MDRGKKIAKNTVLLYMRMFLVMGITLYTSRVVLNVLGIEDFGIYNIVGSIIVLFSFFSNSLTTAVQRYLSFALGKEDIYRFQSVFSQGVWTFIFMSLGVLLLGETLGLYIFNEFIEIPVERQDAAFWVYQLSIFTFIFNILRTPFNASLIAYEKMSFFAYLGIIEVILKLFIVFCIELILFDKLIIYASLIVLVSLCLLIIIAYYCFKRLKGCRISLKFNNSVVRELISFSGWTSLTSISTVISNQGVNVLLNNFFGVLVNAATGISNQIMNAYMQFLGNFQIAFNPQIVKSYASGDIEYFRSLLYRTSLASFYLMVFITVPVIVKMDYILSIWLTNVPAYTNEFSICTIIYFLIESYSGPFWMSVQAIGKIKSYQIVISSTIFLNFFVGLFFLQLNYSPVSVLYIKIFVAILILFIRAYLLNRMMKISLKYYFVHIVLRSLLLFIILLSIMYFIGSFLEGFIGLCITVVVSTLLSAFMIFFIGIDKYNKQIVKKYIKNIYVKYYGNSFFI